MDENFFKSKFDWKIYVNKYEDLQKAGIDTEERAWDHAKSRQLRKEKRDVFNGDQKLLQDFKHFCRTGEVKPIPEKNINDYKYNFKYNNKTLENKLIYKINKYENEKIIINENDEKEMFIIESKEKGICKIYKEKNNYIVYFNNKELKKLTLINNINYINNKFYDLSIIIPVSLVNLSTETLINFDYTLNNFLKVINNSNYKINICISHTENEYNLILDYIIENNDINYIFIKNPYHFNLGYNRNLYKYISNSHKIMFVDIDIPLSKEIIDTMIKKSNDYNIIKPYYKILINLNEKEKYNYIYNNVIPNKEPNKLYSITGGITLFDIKILDNLGGYEEFNGYGHEDRCMDVLVLKKKT